MKSKIKYLLLSFLFMVCFTTPIYAAGTKGYNKEISSGVFYLEYSGDDHLAYILKKDNSGSKILASNIAPYITDSYTKKLISNNIRNINDAVFGCRSVSVKSKNGYLFGRNFDYDNVKNIVILKSKPKNKYASISTIDADMLGVNNIPKKDIQNCSRQDLGLIASYACVDGMNSQGVYASILMVHTGSAIRQNTSKKDVTPSLLVKAILDNCATVDSAICTANSYDMRSNYNIHIAVADKSGKSAVIEWKNNKMTYTNTKVAANVYVSANDNSNTGGLVEFAKQNKKNLYTVDNVRDALKKAKKSNTVWSIVFNTYNKQANYYLRGNYTKKFTYSL